MGSSYAEFLASKRIVSESAGLEVQGLNPMLFDFQADLVRWALRKGRAAVFADTGLGKTGMQLEWARHIPGNVLILAPLAVSRQTVREGEKFGISVAICRSQADAKPGINITNYEMLHHFDPDRFAGIVLDESSCLKSFDSKTRMMIIEAFAKTPFRLACTATPAPNDYMELGNHSEFLGVMSRTEMLAMFFTHDGGDTSKWRLKGHAQDRFWEWVASWAAVLRKPSDLGYSDDGFILPGLEIVEHVVRVDKPTEGHLFAVEALALLDRQRARRESIEARVAEAARIVATKPDEPWLIWCDLNRESELLTKAIPGAVEVKGSDNREHKEQALLGFASGDVRILVSKPSIAGFGMNFQRCANMVFVGLSDSFEQYYQAVRRCYRFGQTRRVEAHIVIAETEGAVRSNIERKERDAIRMAEAMVEYTRQYVQGDMRRTGRQEMKYERDIARGDGWELRLGDCVEEIREVPDDSIHYTIFSPPFASLYTYTNSERDMGNCKTDEEFENHFRFLVGELLRVTLPGRLLSFHCMNLPSTKQRDGVIGIKDFRGELIRLFESTGWIYHSEVVIWKDPVTAMQRTKALGLLHKQIKKDAAMCRQGIPDYLVTMRKPGDNPERVTNTNETFPVSLWQNYASPVWMDISPSRTLQKESARENNDERHICPLQLDVIERALKLWTNLGDLVLDPFAGIGSTGYVALKMERRFLGFELKRSYWQAAVNNLRRAAGEKQQTIFDLVAQNEVESNVGL